MQRKTSHLAGLDLVRFGAALAVMFYHLAAISWLPIGPNYGVSIAPSFEELSWLGVGWIGVQIFFVLSGFVIARSAEHSSAYRFFLGRVGRLFPAVVMCASITLALVLSFHLTPTAAALANYARTVAFDPRGPWIEGVYWTLSLEITFYALILGLLVFKVFHRLELMTWLLAIFSASYVLGRAFLGVPAISEHTLAQHGCFFALGIFLWLSDAKGLRFSRLLGILVCLIAGGVEIDFVAHQRLHGADAVYAPLVWFIGVFAIYLSARIRWRGNRTISSLGLLTYPLYLGHETAGAIALRINVWTGRWLALLFSGLGLILMAWLVSRLERPFRKNLEIVIDALVNYLMNRRARFLLKKIEATDR